MSLDALMNVAYASKTSRDDRNFTREMWNKQTQFIQDMWNQTNEYNTPSAQVQRLIDAGLNPTMAMSNIQTGQAQGGGTPSSPATPSKAVDMRGIMDNIAGMLGLENQLANQKAQTRLINADAKLKEIEAVDHGREILSRIYANEANAKKTNREADWVDWLSSGRYNEMLGNIANNAADTEFKWAQHATQIQLLKYMPIDKSLDWIQRIGNIMETSERIHRTRQETNYLIEKTTSEVFGWKDKEFQYELNKDTREFLYNRRHTEQWHQNPYGFMFEYFGQ